jgi:(S)-mandelate dehydrogenase
MGSVPDFANHRELRELARRRLPRFMFEYVDRGAEDEVGVAHNRAAFDRLKLRPRVLVDVGTRDLSTTIFGKRWSMPIGIGPAGSAAMLWFRGERELALAAKAAGIPYCLSGGSSLRVEDAVEIGGIPWFQLYVFSDHALTHRIIDRLAVSGTEALIITADTPASPIREYNARNGFTVPFYFNRANIGDMIRHPRWALRVGLRYALGPGLPKYENVPDELQISVAGKPVRMTVSPRFDWDAFAEVRRKWKRPLLLKGVMTPEDARRAVEIGADGIVISNHGGRNLDSAPATIDGGIRRGSDAVKALALGADAVLAGRLPLLAVGVGGAPAVEHLLGRLRHELDTCMAMTGARSIADIGPEMLFRPRP